MFLRGIPGTAQHAVVRCRTAIISDAVFETIPDQRFTAFALHRIRDTR
jgi:hypothetical protein